MRTQTLIPQGETPYQSGPFTLRRYKLEKRILLVRRPKENKRIPDLRPDECIVTLLGIHAGGHGRWRELFRLKTVHRHADIVVASWNVHKSCCRICCRLHTASRGIQLGWDGRHWYPCIVLNVVVGNEPGGHTRFPDRHTLLSGETESEYR